MMRAVMFFLLLALGATDSNAAATQPDPGSVRLASVTNSGSGCASNTVSSVISSDRTLISYVFDDFTVFTGPNTRASEWTRNCQLNTTIQKPEGFQFAISNVTWKGAVRIDSGASVVILSTWYMGDVSTVKQFTFTPDRRDVRDEYVFQNATSLSPEEMAWSRCDGTDSFMSNSRAAMRSTSATVTGYIGDGPQLTPRLLQLGLKWRECAS